jgi:plastocyanin domain-containing protein
MTSRDPLVGALTLGTFAVGTAPGLLGIGGLSSIIKGNLAKMFFKSAGVAVVGLAFFNIFNGLNLTGNSIIDALETKNTRSDTQEISGKNVNGIQIIKMGQNSDGYKPNTFTVKVGIPVRWEVESNSSYTCASSLSVPKLNYRKILSQGQNIIEFTPTEVGSINFSCSMGMFRGVFNVID